MHVSLFGFIRLGAFLGACWPIHAALGWQTKETGKKKLPAKSCMYRIESGINQIKSAKSTAHRL